MTARFMSKVVPEPNTGCWFWLGRTRGGYGSFDIKGPKRAQYVHRNAHRVAYELFVGEIPEGKELHHSCEQRLCVNPEHLEPLTRKEHSRTFPQYATRRAKTHCLWGHPYGDNPPIRKRGRVCVACAREASRRSYLRKKEVASSPR